MNNAVYRHILQTYGRIPSMWIGMLAEAIRSFLLRVYVTVIMATTAGRLVTGDISGAKRSILYFFIAYTVGSIIGAAGELLSIWTEDEEYNQLLIRFYRKLTGKDMAFYRDHQTGYLVSLFRQYLDASLQMVRFLRSDALRTLISLVVPPFILAMADWRIGLLAIGLVAVQLVYIGWALQKVLAYRVRAHEVYRQLTAEVSDHVTNILAYKAGGKEEEGAALVRALANEECRLFWMRHRTPVVYDLPRAIFTAAGVAGAFYLTVRTKVDAASISLLVLTLTYMFQIIRNVAEIPTFMIQHDEFMTKIYPALHYLDDDQEMVKDPAHPQACTITRGAVSIHNLDFYYPVQPGAKHEPVPVFRNLNLEIAPGEQIGVVGLSGAGKSTLANLLMRFDDVTAGSIAIDGVDIRTIRQTELRQHIAYVPQEPLLFHRTIRENIAYFNSKATDEEIIRAAKAAHAHEFIMQCPAGYDTLVGERGIKLSGGQKQRVAIARAILKHAPLMIFDEATSALDSESEQIIQQALPEILGKQTALIIAHRLSTVAKLDRIVVMHEGKIVEQGTHAQLLKLDGRYAALWKRQTLMAAQS